MHLSATLCLINGYWTSETTLKKPLFESTRFFALHWHLFPSLGLISQTFHPASSIDLDERTVALGTIALGGGGLEEFELEFPASEPDFNLLPEHDDNLLSLHDARRKVLLTGGRHSGLGGMESSSSSVSHIFDMGDTDLLRPPSEIDSSIEVERGGADVEPSRRMQVDDGYEPDPYGGLDFGPSAADVPAGDFSFGEHDPAANYSGPDFRDFEPNISIGAFSDAPSLPGNTSFQQPDEHVFAVPTSGPRAKRTWGEMVDRTTTLDDAVLRKQIKDKFCHDGPNRVSAPQTREEQKRENILESVELPIMRQTPLPLRPLLSKALAQRPAPREQTDDLRFDPNDINDSYNPADEIVEVNRGDDDVRNKSFDRSTQDDPNRWIGMEPGVDEYPVPEISDYPEFTPHALDRSGELVMSTHSEDAEAAPKALSTNAHQIVTYVQRELKRQHPDHTGSYEFGQVFPHPTYNRRQIAQSFLGLLELKTKNYIELSQDEPYGQIEFSFKDTEVPSLPASQIEASS